MLKIYKEKVKGNIACTFGILKDKKTVQQHKTEKSKFR